MAGKGSNDEQWYQPSFTRQLLSQIILTINKSCNKVNYSNCPYDPTENDRLYTLFDQINVKPSKNARTGVNLSLHIPMQEMSMELFQLEGTKQG